MRARPIVVAGLLLVSACRAGEPAGDGRPVGEGSSASVPVVSASIPSPAPKLRGNYAAVPLRPHLSMWYTPGTSAAADFAFDARDPFGRIAPLLVDGVRADSSGRFWYRLLLPVRPNGMAAWVRQEEVRLVRRNERIVVDLSQRTLRHFVRNHLEESFAVGIGTPQTPTTSGRFYVWVRVSYATRDGPYGVFALGLSGFSSGLTSWPGGGRLAIHGTSDPSDRGKAVSHGCVRVFNPEMLQLQGVPLGTPVIINP
ncbi:MAG: L,D-transpeptidase [Actinomycetota bacterium]